MKRTGQYEMHGMNKKQQKIFIKIHLIYGFKNRNNK